MFVYLQMSDDVPYPTYGLWCGQGIQYYISVSIPRFIFA